MKRLVWAGGILAYVLFLIAMIPAAGALWAVERLGPYKLMAESASGTLWNGKARGIVLAAQGKPPLVLGDCAWSLNPLGLLRGGLPADISFTGANSGQAKIVLGFKHVEIRQADIRIPATILAYAVPALYLYPLQGILHISGQDLALQGDSYQGHGKIDWEQAGIVLNKPLALGQYRLKASASGKDIAFDLQSGPDSALAINGSGTWSIKSGLKYKGSARTAADEPELARMLSLMGPKQRNGYYAIELVRPALN